MRREVVLRRQPQLGRLLGLAIRMVIACPVFIVTRGLGLFECPVRLGFPDIRPLDRRDFLP